MKLNVPMFDVNCGCGVWPFRPTLSADAASLESLAAMTGGRSLAPEELSGLIRQLTQQTESLQVRQESKRTLWTKAWYTWAFFLVLVALLGVEWYLRKRWRLV